MAQNASASTLFHLVPFNDTARETLHHPDNRRFVSRSTARDLGLEVGFHVSSVPGRVIARLGRDADLILQQRNVSAVHVAFELHPETLLVLLSVRLKRLSLVTVGPLSRGGGPIEGGEYIKGGEPIEGDCVLHYGEVYRITIVDYVFDLVWRQDESEPLRALAVKDYRKALQQQAHVRSRKLPTEGDSEAYTWHNTRIHTA